MGRITETVVSVTMCVFLKDLSVERSFKKTHIVMTESY